MPVSQARINSMVSICQMAAVPNREGTDHIYDARWDCRLFLNYATITSDLELDQQNIAKHLQMELKVSQDNLEGAFAFEKVHEKYSVSAKENRCYRHRFYQFLIKQFDEKIEQDSFEIDGKKFYWMPSQRWSRISE